jgi:hypothetical protein
MHRYVPNLARGDLPLVAYEKLHDTTDPRFGFDQIWDRWQEALANKVTPAALGRADRFFLLTVLLKRFDAKKQWLFDRCREVEANTDGYLDLWAREHYKSTLITFAGIIQEVLRDPEITVCIFSHTRPNANKFLSQIKREFEHNEDLQDTYPEILWKKAYKDAPLWSLAKGITVKRESNPKEATIEAAGLVDGMPTGSHYKLRVYDDVVTSKSVSTPEQVSKTTEMYYLSDNLGARGPDGLMREWAIGTRYTFADTYQTIIDKKSLKVRIHAATDDGTRAGNPVFLSREALDAKLRGPASIFAAQQLQNPASGTEAMFKVEWLRFSDIRPATLNVYIMCDPAGSKKKDSDNTAISAVGIDAGRTKWLLDGYRHKMGLMERWMRIKELRTKWMEMPGVQHVFVGYESYGIPDALDYFEERMEIEKISFEITVLQWPRQEAGSKNDRVMRLEPDFRAGKFILPAVPMRIDEHGVAHVIAETANQKAMKDRGQAFRIYTPITRVDENGKAYTVRKGFLDEYLYFPFSQRKDFIDATSRIYDMDPQPPIVVDEKMLEPEVFEDGA